MEKLQVVARVRPEQTVKKILVRAVLRVINYRNKDEMLELE